MNSIALHARHEARSIQEILRRALDGVCDFLEAPVWGDPGNRRLGVVTA